MKGEDGRIKGLSCTFWFCFVRYARSIERD